MAYTNFTTFKTLIETLLEEAGLGCVLPSCTGTTTALTLANSYAAGPFLAQKFQRASPILTTAGTAINENTYVDSYVASTGVITTTPAVTGAYTSAVLAYAGSGIDHMDRVKEAINRALTKRCTHLVRVPFTQGLTGSDMRGELDSTVWQYTSNATASYSETIDGENGVDRTLDVTTTGASGYVSTGNIPVHAAEVWDFQTAMITYSGSYTARITFYDATNAATITPTFTIGSATTTSKTFVNVMGYLTIPSGCSQMQIRLTGDESGATVGFAPVVTAVRGAKLYPAGSWLRSTADIGNLWTVSYEGGTTTAIGPESARWYRWDGPYNVQTFRSTAVFDFFGQAPPFPLYYEAFVPGESLTAMTDQMAFDPSYVLLWAKYELRKMLYERETDKEKKRQAKVLAMEAKKSADRYEFNTTDLLVVSGRN